MSIEIIASDDRMTDEFERIWKSSKQGAFPGFAWKL